MFVLCGQTLTLPAVSCRLGKFPGIPTNGQSQKLVEAVEEHATTALKCLDGSDEIVGENIEVHLVCIAGTAVPVLPVAVFRRRTRSNKRTGSATSHSSAASEASDLGQGAGPFSFKNMVEVASQKAAEVVLGPDARVGLAFRVPVGDALAHAAQYARAVNDLGFFKKDVNLKLRPPSQFQAITTALGSSIGVTPANECLKHARTKLLIQKDSGIITCDAFPSFNCWGSVGLDQPEVRGTCVLLVCQFFLF